MEENNVTLQITVHPSACLYNGAINDILNNGVFVGGMFCLFVSVITEVCR